MLLCSISLKSILLPVIYWLSESDIGMAVLEHFFQVLLAVIWLLVMLIKLAVFAVRLRICSKRVQGTVIRMEPYDISARETRFKPVIQYEYGGQQYESDSCGYVRGSCFEDGQEILLRVNPRHPERMLIPGREGRKLLASGFKGILFAAAVWLYCHFVPYLAPYITEDGG